MATYEHIFSGAAEAYRQYRPGYPDSLFEALVTQAPDSGLAVDIGCGSGQATGGLARVFERVLAVDSSPEQLAQTPALEGITLKVGSAECIPAETGSASLLLAAQAAHWFDRPRFYAEAERVLKPEGLCALVYYDLCWIEQPEVHALAERFQVETMAEWWPDMRTSRLVDSYAPIAQDFPFPRCEFPPMAIRVRWDMSMLLGYMSSWSAVQCYRDDRPDDPLVAIEAQLRADWPDEGMALLSIHWPLRIIAGPCGVD